LITRNDALVERDLNLLDFNFPVNASIERRFSWAAARAFLKYRDGQFRAHLLYEAYREIVLTCLWQSCDIGKIALQIPICNSIVVYLIAPDNQLTSELTVDQSFGGLEFQRLRIAGLFKAKGVTARCYFREAVIANEPSVVRCSEASFRVVNNFWVFSPAYVMLALASNIRTTRKNAQPAVVRRESPALSEVDILLPIWNSPRLFSRLFADLSRTLPLVGPKLHLIIRNDKSDNFATECLISEVEKLRSSRPDVGIDLTHNEENLGFINNSNLLFKDSNAGIVILLTSDIRLPDNWLGRLVRPLLLEEDIVLATPFAVNGTNLDIAVPPGLSWRDLDTAAGELEPSFPDAETTVGYCLAVKRSSFLQSETLFDDVYVNGYGDDSDLYYRMVNRGLRGVVVDDLVIYHSGGGSFSLVDNVECLREENHRRFMDRWHDAYIHRVHEKAKVVRKCADKVFSAVRPNRSVGDAIFILPTGNTTYGGVKVVSRLIEGSRDLGIDVGGIVLSDYRKSPETGAAEYEFFDRKALEDWNVRKHRIVLATAHNTVPWGRSLADLWGSELWYFVQGPEGAFSGGRYARSVLESYRAVDKLLCVSEYLAEMIKHVSGLDAEIISLGPDHLEFYPSGLRRADREIAIQYSGRAEKGSDLAAIASLSLVAKGFHVLAFGEAVGTIDYPEGVTPLGQLTPSELRRLFQRVSFYVDLSRYEGLGLLALEAQYCGAIPVYLNNGGSARELSSLGIGIALDSVDAVHRLGETCATFLAGDLREITRRDPRPEARHSLEAAIQKIAGLIDGRQ
jgi:GT2 family glycosyltransferase